MGEEWAINSKGYNAISALMQREGLSLDQAIAKFVDGIYDELGKNSSKDDYCKVLKVLLT